jgi:hypothetical protein
MRAGLMTPPNRHEYPPAKFTARYGAATDRRLVTNRSPNRRALIAYVIFG